MYSKKGKSTKNCQKQSSNRKMDNGCSSTFTMATEGTTQAALINYPRPIIAWRLQESTRRRKLQIAPISTRRASSMPCENLSHICTYPFLSFPRPRPRFFSPSLHTHAHPRLPLPLPGSSNQQMINIRPHSTCVPCESLQREKPPVNWCQSRTHVSTPHARLVNPDG